MHQNTPIPCRCWACRAELGTTDGTALYLSDRASIRRPMTIWCTCGGATFWRPSVKRETVLPITDSPYVQ